MTNLRFRASFPREAKGKAMRVEIFNALRLIRVRMIEEFEKTTATWDHKVDFKKEGSPVVRERELTGTIEVSTDDEIYILVNEGSPEHMIFPRGDYPLFWHSKYTAKTAPGVLDSFEGGAGNKDRVTDFVEHPGFTGRHFDQQVVQELTPLFLYELRAAMRKIAQASGWAK